MHRHCRHLRSFSTLHLIDYEDGIDSDTCTDAGCSACITEAELS